MPQTSTPDIPLKSFDLPQIPSHSRKVLVPADSQGDKENKPLNYGNIGNESGNGIQLKFLETERQKRMLTSNTTRQYLPSQRNLKSQSNSTSKNNLLPISRDNKPSFLDTERDVSSIRARIKREASSPSMDPKDSVHKITLTGLSSHNQRRKHLASSSSIRSRILRYGETVDSLFYLEKDCPEEHRTLCNDIVNGNKLDDTKAWKIALEYASTNAKKSEDGQNLIRLHRRATSRLMTSRSSGEVTSAHLLSIYLSYANAQSLFSSRNEARQTYKYILNRRIGEYDAALYLAISDFEWNEGRKDLAKEALVRGLEKKANPVDQLRKRLEELGYDADNVSQNVRHQQDGKGERDCVTCNANSFGKMQVPPLPSSYSCNKSKLQTYESIETGSSNGAQNGIVTEKVSLNRKVEIDASMRSKARIEASDITLCKNLADHDLDEDIIFSKKNIRKTSNQQHKSIDDEDTIALPNATESIPVSEKNDEQTSNTNVTITEECLSRSQLSGSLEFEIQPKTTQVMDPCNKSSCEPSKTGTEKIIPFDECLKSETRKVDKSISNDRPFQNIHSHSVRSRITGVRPSSILSRNTRSGMLGGALRVDPKSVELSTVDSDDSDFDEIRGDEKSGLKKRSEQFSKPSPKIPKITRTDLSYMLNWDPMKSRKQASPSSGPTKDSGRSRFDIGPAMEKIEEESPTDGQSTAGYLLNGLTDSFSTNASDDKSIQKAVDKENLDCDNLSNGSKNKLKTERSPLEGKVPFDAMNNSFYSPKQAALIAKANIEFLPLVSEENMCAVNSIPYAKLGVIGKGGSCKVYRALSKECAVLAIKKVKLDGMDQKAINGYANEIALLKRLRGNPAIIQLYDSEVDLERKSIFLVMELGEVDLNHVLQKQAKMQESNQGAPGRFNINFIRLTWQQMLSAVHSIHEERIIHSDLKPANFLFVRGALKLIDFGIAKAIQSEDTTNIYRDSQIGTLNYMSPEAILDTGSGGDRARMRLGRASDIWSLGCILYQMIYGRTPFAELHMIQKLQAIVNPHHEIRYPNVSEEAALDVIKLCLQRDPSKRPPIVGKKGLLNEHRFLNSSI